MAYYYIAVKSGVGYVVLPERFGVRSNADRFARRHRWEGYFIATETQRLTIEANQYLGEGNGEIQTSASQTRSHPTEMGLEEPDKRTG